MRPSLSNVNCLNMMSFSERTREVATKDSPAANSLLPRSILVFIKVSPWLLCTVMAHARRMGSCKREHFVPFSPSHVLLIGTIGTTLTPSKLVIVGPSYFSNLINTTTGREGRPCSSNIISYITPIEPFTNLAPVHTLAVNIILTTVDVTQDLLPLHCLLFG